MRLHPKSIGETWTGRQTFLASPSLLTHSSRLAPSFLLTPLAFLVLLALPASRSTALPSTLDFTHTAIDGSPWEGGVHIVSYDMATHPDTGQPAIAAFDAWRKRVVYRTLRDSRWTCDLLREYAQPEIVQYPRDFRLAFDPITHHPRVSYSDGSSGQIRLHLYDGTRWLDEVPPSSCWSLNAVRLPVDPTTSTVFLAWCGNYVDPGNFSKTTIFFGRRLGPGLYESEILDSCATIVGGASVDAAADPQTGEICLAYYMLESSGSSSFSLRFARRTAGGWVKETVGAPGYSGSTLNLAFVRRGQDIVPAILQEYSTNGGAYWYRLPAGWVKENGPTGYDIARSFQPDPVTRYASFVSFSNTPGVQLHQYNGSAWTNSAIAPSLLEPRLAFSPSGTITVSAIERLDSNFTVGRLHGFRGAATPLARETLIDWRQPGIEPHALFDPNRQRLWIGYRDGISGTVMLATVERHSVSTQVLDSSGGVGGPTLLLPPGAEKPLVVYSRAAESVMAVPSSVDGHYEFETIHTGSQHAVAMFDRTTTRVLAVLLTADNVLWAKRNGPNNWTVDTLPNANRPNLAYQPRIAQEPNTGNPWILYFHRPSSPLFGSLRYTGTAWVDMSSQFGGELGIGAPEFVVDPAANELLFLRVSGLSYELPRTVALSAYDPAHQEWNSRGDVYQVQNGAYLMPRLQPDPSTGNLAGLILSNSGGLTSFISVARSGGAWSHGALFAGFPIQVNIDNHYFALSSTGRQAIVAFDNKQTVLHCWNTAGLMSVDGRTWILH